MSSFSSCQLCTTLVLLLFLGTSRGAEKFAIRKIRSSLVAKNTGFITVDLDISVGSRLAYFVWKKQIRSGSRHYWVPMTSTNDVIVDQSEWLEGEEEEEEEEERKGLYLRQTLTYVTVPSDVSWIVHQFALSLEDGLSYTRTLTLPVQHGNNKTIFTPASGVSLSDYVTKSNSDVIQLLATSLQPLAVKVFAYTLHKQRPVTNDEKSSIDAIIIDDGSSQIYDISAMYDDNMASVRSPLVGVFHASHCRNVSDVELQHITERPFVFNTTINVNNSNLCVNDTANCRVSSLFSNSSDAHNQTAALTLTCIIDRHDTTVRIMQALPVNTSSHVDSKPDQQQQQQQRIVARFETGDELLDVCSDGGGSLLPHRALRVEVSACDPQSQRRPGRFEFSAEVDNCIVCTAAGNPRPEVTLYHDGFPVGSWSGHSVYSYSPQRDTAAVLLLLAQPFAGTFYCAARLHTDDESIAVEFHIDVKEN